MRVTFLQLEAFYWIARLSSVKEAARHLHLAAPTVSLRIDQLEAELGSPLFERAGRGIALTHHAEALLPRVALMVEEYAKFRTLAKGDALESGILRIGTTETFAQACLPAYMRAISERYPALQLEFVVGTSANLERDILDRRLDVAFSINPTGDPKLTLVPLGVQSLTWAAATQFNLPSPLRPSDLHNVLVITNPHPAPMWRQITDWFRQTGAEPNMICRCSSPTVVAQLVTAGLGVSLLPRWLIQGAIDKGIVRALESKLPLQPSRMFGIYRFADSGQLIQEIIELGANMMNQSELISQNVTEIGN